MAQHRQQPDPCRLLSLPVELRLIIYELVFDTEATVGTSIDIITIRPPNGAFLGSCRTVYNEAVNIYSHACTRFFTHSFTVDDRESTLSLDSFDQLSDRYLQAVTRLVIMAPDGYPLVRQGGVWYEPGMSGYGFQIVSAEELYPRPYIHGGVY